MTSERGGVRSLLDSAFGYQLFQRIITKKSIVVSVIESSFGKDLGGLRVLDIGCGPASLLSAQRDWLDPKLYFGIDPSEEYVLRARKAFPKATFHIGTVGEIGEKRNDFDLVYLGGVLHHVDDAEAAQILNYSKARARSGGKIISIDPTIIPGQNPISRFLVRNDRGRYVRSIEGMTRLFDEGDPFVAFSVKHHRGYLRVPYDHVVCIGEVL